jgi:hypothetical protein
MLKMVQRLREHYEKAALFQLQDYYLIREMRLKGIGSAKVMSPDRSPDDNSATAIARPQYSVCTAASMASHYSHNILEMKCLHSR